MSDNEQTKQIILAYEKSTASWPKNIPEATATFQKRPQHSRSYHDNPEAIATSPPQHSSSPYSFFSFFSFFSPSSFCISKLLWIQIQNVFNWASRSPIVDVIVRLIMLGGCEGISKGRIVATIFEEQLYEGKFLFVVESQFFWKDVVTN